MNRNEIRTKMKQAIDTRFSFCRTTRVRCPSLQVMAKYIETYLKFRINIRTWHESTDRHPKGVRWRIPGKGRNGHKLEVFDKDVEIFCHNTAETYRHNTDVARWILEQEEKL